MQSYETTDQKLIATFRAIEGLPSSPHQLRQQTNPYYLDGFAAWFHDHNHAGDGYSAGSSGLLVQVRADILRCEHCDKEWAIPPPDAKWVASRTRRVDEVLRRIQPTDNASLWLCPSRTPPDARVYRIRDDADVSRWTCTCRDWRDHQHRFWGGCKHVRAVQQRIANELARLSRRRDRQELPVGRPVRGDGWRGTLLTRCNGGVAYLELQGVEYTAPRNTVWDDITRRGFAVSTDCQWYDIAHDMAHN